MYVDPTGHLAGWVIALIYIGAIALTAGTTLGYAAITGEPVVFDVSYTWANFLFPGVNLKGGISAIVDLKDKYIEFYLHLGLSFGLSSGWSFAVGSLENYEKQGDYEGVFIFGGGGYYGGLDHCFGPFDPYKESVKATAITIGTGTSLYAGVDYYKYMPEWTIYW